MLTCYARIQLHVYEDQEWQTHLDCNVCRFSDNDCLLIYTLHVGLYAFVAIILISVIKFLSLIKYKRILWRMTMTGIYMFNLFDFFFTNKEKNESSLEYFQLHY